MAKKVKKDKDLKSKAAIIALCAVIMIAAGLVARAVKPDAQEADGKVETVSSAQHEAIKAEVVDNDPSHYMIDVGKLSNIRADQDADTFAVYVSSSLPKTCGDFRELELKYEKPSEHTRLFDLSDHPEVLDAIDNYGCVVMRNIPPSAG